MTNLNEIPFLTHEVGSLRKPAAFLKASKNQILDEDDLNGFTSFLDLIDFHNDREEIIGLFKQSNPDNKDDENYHTLLAEWRVRLNVKYKESTGIDLIDSGEWIRREMYQHLMDNNTVSGIKMLSHVRSFDYNFYKPGIYESKINYDPNQEIHLQEFLWAKKYATKPLKVCITAFNTAVEWSYLGRQNFEDFMYELIDEVFIPESIKLLKNGVNWLQMDEPALTTHPKHVDFFADAWNYWVDKIKPYTNSDTVLGLHNCFSNYDLLWPILPELKDLGAITLEFANRDTWQLGTDDSSRKAFSEVGSAIKRLYAEETGFKAKAALGVLPVHTDHEPSPELIRDRLLYINSLISDPRLVLAAPDCGLRQRSLEKSHILLSNMSRGAELARKAIE